jgi:hypothetical protein
MFCSMSKKCSRDFPARRAAAMPGLRLYLHTLSSLRRIVSSIGTVYSSLTCDEYLEDEIGDKAPSRGRSLGSGGVVEPWLGATIKLQG